MSIDEAIHDTEVMKEYLEYRDEPRSEGLGVAIEIMRKYQKIKDVVADFNNQYNHRTPLDLMCEVKEVVEDGSDTNS